LIAPSKAPTGTARQSLSKENGANRSAGEILIDAAWEHWIERGGCVSHCCDATHDEKRIAFAKSYAEKVGLPKNGLEFQMLYGIRRDMQENLAKQGYPVRVYVPFGTHWYPYFMRRLAERPANIWFFISNLLKG
jgi:hypothetical protein